MDIDRIIELYLSGLSATRVADVVGKTPASIYYILEREGVPRRSNRENSRRYSVSHSFFDNISDGCRAYWLGFMFADGYVTGTAQKQVGVALSSQDSDHLHKMSRCMQSTYPVKEYTPGAGGYSSRPYSRVLITSSRMHDSLVALGCTHRKSLTLLGPVIPEEYERDFIRGYCDGDGSIKKTKGAASGFRLSLCGTEEMLEWISERVPRPGGRYRARGIYQADWHSDNIKYLYENSTHYLERKMLRARECF